MKLGQKNILPDKLKQTNKQKTDAEVHAIAFHQLSLIFLDARGSISHT